MKAVAVALLLALPAYGQGAQPCEVFPIEVSTGTIRTTGDVPLAVRGGAYLTTESHICVARELAALRAEVAVWREATTVNPTVLIIASSLAIVLGGAVGYFAARQ